MNIFDELKIRGLVAQVSGEEDLSSHLEKNRVCFYIGFDPTADSLHAGSLMQILIIRRFQDAGHDPIILFGGGTALIGDPSLKNAMRKMLSPEEIENNIEKFKEQVKRIINVDNLKIVNNASWLCSLNYMDFLKEIGVYFSINKMLAAKSYEMRLETGLTFFELNYMVMQSYDYFLLNKDYNCTLQIGGDDQWSNILSGTELIRKKSKKDAFALTTNLLTTSDGKKMGKTESGALWLDKEKTSVYDFFQYWRNINDADVIKFFKALTLVNLDDIEEYGQKFKVNPNEIKEILAFEITSLVHGCEEATNVLKISREFFSKTANFENVPKIKIDEKLFTNGKIRIVNLVKACGFASSLTKANNLIEQGGIYVNDKQIKDRNEQISKNDLTENDIIIKKGKKKFIRPYV